ncbi:Volume-regulated anion channel subunit LRRC8D [Acipenser ruthenus]|uniref:Volume-regulated anion channel subunit LRRC8D n=1 Tax=Acipenser ruthenus TaxID=7906 RepID=A0A444V1S2_ACIRT|nr:Volume-regulated anion channel subunit LRRC8D [Acipenser ruthenus]
MFTLSELASLSETHTTHRILKPWWDVFMEYLVFAMLMVSIFSGTLLISNEQVVCLPMDQTDPANDSSTPNPTATPHTTPDTPTPTPTPDTNPPKNTADPLSPPVKERGRPTNLDYQQYVYISQEQITSAMTPIYILAHDP